MSEKDLTYLDAINQFWKACEDGDRRTLTSVGLLYYHLCNLWNICGRPISFRRQNTSICNDLFISKPTLDRQRNVLKQQGLIDFFSRGKGDPNITYQILDLRRSKIILLPEVKKVKNFTSDFTSDFTSHDCIKQSKELFIEIKGEVKNFYYLKNLFETDVGLTGPWIRQGFKPEEFTNGLQQWLEQNHTAKYEDLIKARRHFLFWIPNYCKSIQQKNGVNGNGHPDHKLKNEFKEARLKHGN